MRFSRQLSLTLHFQAGLPWSKKMRAQNCWAGWRDTFCARVGRTAHWRWTKLWASHWLTANNYIQTHRHRHGSTAPVIRSKMIFITKCLHRSQSLSRVGFRIEHETIATTKHVLVRTLANELGAADYNWFIIAKMARSVYSSGMLPWLNRCSGNVGRDRVVTNGMSHIRANERNANSAVVVRNWPFLIIPGGP